MRTHPTPAEEALWQVLRADGLGVRFRRQFVIGRFIVDFACRTRMLIVEVDGGIHDDAEAQEADALRTAGLEEVGYTVIRFRNREVLEDRNGVVAAIKEALVPPSPPPSPRGS